MISRRGFVPVLSHRLEYVRLEPATPTRARRPTLVFLHDGLGSLSLWRNFPRDVVAATGCPAVVYSRRGHGQSDVPAAARRADYLHVEANAMLPEFLAQLSVEQPVLIGHSDGASIALIHAASGFEVRGIVAMAPHVFVEGVTLRGIAAMCGLHESADLRGRLAKHHRDPDLLFRAWADTWLAPGFRDWNIESMLPAIRCPLLLLQGEDDEYGTLDQLTAIARGVRARVESMALTGVGHSPWRDAPDAVCAAIAAFVGSLD
jgi:pimeloyl-ACP methyl ester carboxylesterase